MSQPTSRRISSQLAYWFFATALVACTLLADRSRLIDQEAYVSLFLHADWDWLRDLGHGSKDLLVTLAEIFTEEAGWRIWCVIATDLLQLDPETATRVTACLLNLLIVLGLSRSRRPILSLLLWAVVPAGFCFTGFTQIRQGFAFSLFVCFSMLLRRPLLGAVLGALVHTTIVLILPFTIVALSSVGDDGAVHRKRSLVAGTALVVLMAALGPTLFLEYGGRRVETYSIDEGATSLNFVVTALLFVAVPLGIVYDDNASLERRWVSVTALVYLQLIFFVCVSFFVFPLGTARVSYFVFLFQVMLMGEVSFGIREKQIGAMLAAALLFYQTVKIYSLGGYNEILRSFS